MGQVQAIKRAMQDQADLEGHDREAKRRKCHNSQRDMEQALGQLFSFV